MGVLDGKAAIVTGFGARHRARNRRASLPSTERACSVNDLDGDVAEQAANEIEGETAVFAGDLTAEGAPDALVQAAVDAFGQIDIVVNNAGYTWDGMAHKMSDEQFRAMLEIHTVVPFKVLRAAAPYLRDAGKADKEAGPRGLPQGRQRHLDLRHAGQRRPDQLRGCEGRARRVDEDARARMGAVQGQRERRRLRVHRHAADGVLRGRRRRSSGAVRRSSSASRSTCASSRRRSSRSAERARPRRPRARSSSSAPRGRTSCKARC